MNGQQQGGYPPQGGGYPPQGGGYPPQGGGYPPQGGGYPPQGGGYPPQAGYPGGYPGGPAPRSGAPKVMGILMIIFAAIGLILSLYRLTATPSAELPGEFLKSLKTYVTITEVIGLLLSITHLVGGIFAVGYKPKAPLLATIYGAGTIAMNLIGVVLYYVIVAPKLKDVGGSVGEAVGNLGGAMLIVGTVVASIWPTLVLILMNTKGAKAACSGQQ